MLAVTDAPLLPAGPAVAAVPAVTAVADPPDVCARRDHGPNARVWTVQSTRTASLCRSQRGRLSSGLVGIARLSRLTERVVIACALRAS
jgi:hypothetical protein